MRSILIIDQYKILNIKFKKFKNLKKNHNINKVKIFSFFTSNSFEMRRLCKRVLLLESLTGEIFKINKFVFFDDSKKHSHLGVLIYLKVNVFKKKIYPCLSFFFVHQLFFYYEFLLKVKSFDSNEYLNYFYFNPVRTKSYLSTSFHLFFTWADLNHKFITPFFRKRIKITFNNDEVEPFINIGSTPLDLIIFYKFNQTFWITLKVLKKNMLKLLIFFYKKFFLLRLLDEVKSSKLKLFLAKKYLAHRSNVKA